MRVILALLAMALSPICFSQQSLAADEEGGLEQSQTVQEPPELAAVRNDYANRMAAKIRRNLIRPSDLRENIQAEVEVWLLPGGNLLRVTLTKSSGNTAYDNAVERAVVRAQPLPVPPDPALFKYFMRLNLKFNSQE